MEEAEGIFGVLPLTVVFAVFAELRSRVADSDANAANCTEAPSIGQQGSCRFVPQLP